MFKKQSFIILSSLTLHSTCLSYGPQSHHELLQWALENKTKSDSQLLKLTAVDEELTTNNPSCSFWILSRRWPVSNLRHVNGGDRTCGGVMCVTVCAAASRCFNPWRAFTDSVSSHSLQKNLLLNNTHMHMQIFFGTRSAMQTGPTYTHSSPA